MSTGVMITVIIAIVVNKTNQVFVKPPLSNTETKQKIHWLFIELQKASGGGNNNHKKNIIIYLWLNHFEQKAIVTIPPILI